MSVPNEIRFLVRVGVLTALVVVAKVAIHALNWEVISLNALFTGIIAANVFLMGFLLSGVLADYKESEKLPGELSACLENLAQETMGIGLAKPEIDTRPCVVRISQIGEDVVSYLYKKLDIAGLLESVNDLTVQFAGLDPATQGTWVSRLKAEQSNLRRTVIRINTIRETSFVSIGYLLAYTITLLICLGLIFTGQDPWYESILFSGVIAFLMIFLLTLIRDLDNPFGYYEGASSADVTLQPLRDTVARLAQLAGTASAPEARAAVKVAAAKAAARAAAPAAPAAPAAAPVRGGVVAPEDVFRLRDLKNDPARIIRHADETGRPVLLTSGGRGVAVVQALSEFESAPADPASIRASLDGHGPRKP
jgi:prevent-host-death family protein